MSVRRSYRVARGIAVVGGLVLGLVNVAAALLATRPKLTTLLGWDAADARSPESVGVEAEKVDYLPGQTAWWIRAPSETASVVIVHGFETSDDPKATDLGPRLEVAAALQRVGISSLIINLGYAGGARPFTGGPAEAADISAAVDWIHDRSSGPVGLFGVSAGGHSCVAAAWLDQRIAAVVTDSAFVNAGETVAEQAAGMIGAPSALLAPAPHLMRLFNGSAPIALETATSRRVAMLHIHGDADTAVPVENTHRLAPLTGGAVWVVPDADHVRSHSADAPEYERRVVAFFLRALAVEQPTPPRSR